MNVKIDNYVITSDPLQYILNEQCKRSEKSKTPGETYLSPLGYYGSLHSLLVALYDKKLRASSATTVKALMADIKKATELVQRAVRLINEGGNQ